MRRVSTCFNGNEVYFRTDSSDYELNVSNYPNEHPYVLNIPFDDLQDKPPGRYKEYLKRKDDDHLTHEPRGLYPTSG